MNDLEVEKVVQPCLAEWIDRGMALFKEVSGHQWAIADWMLWGEVNFGIKTAYDIAENITEFSRKTLREWAYVARHVSIRMDNLSFGHHQVVAALLPDAQKRCLTHALEKGLSVGETRDMARWQPRPIQVEPENKDKMVSIAFKLTRRELDLTEIGARHLGFCSDEEDSAACRLIRQIVLEYIKAHPDWAQAAQAEYDELSIRKQEVA